MTDSSSTRHNPKLLPPVPDAFSLGAGPRRYGDILATVEIVAEDADQLKRWLSGQQGVEVTSPAGALQLTVQAPLPRLSGLLASAYAAGLAVDTVIVPRTEPK